MTFSLGLFSHSPIAASLLVVLLVIGFAITSYFVTVRLKHKKLKLTGVLLANAIAVLTIIGLAFDIKIATKQVSVTYLVTSGVNLEQLAKIDTQQTVFVMRDAVKYLGENDALKKARVIDTPSHILSEQPQLDNLHVLGDGLSSAQWQALQALMGETFNHMSVSFSASRPRTGLVNMQWPREVTVGQYVNVQGQLQAAKSLGLTNNIYQLDVVNPVGEVIETLRLKATDSFNVSFPAKSTGQWVYRLQLSKPNESDLFADEPLAISVDKPSPLNILIKQSAPSFETRQLQNWAASFGSKITILTQISQSKEIRQNINQNTQSLPATNTLLTQHTLASFDWLVIDGRALLNLNVEQMTALHVAVKQGLGIYIMADEELANAWPVTSLDWLTDIKIRPLDIANYSAIPYWPHSKIEQSMPLVKASITTKGKPALVRNIKEQTLVSRNAIGLGQVAVSLINATYGWQTSGLTAQYSHYWQSVIVALSRPKQTPYWLTTQHDSLALVNQPAKKCLVGSTILGLTTLNQNPQSLLLAQDLLQTEKHCLTLWPTKNGWHELEWNQSTKRTNLNSPVNLGITNWLYAFSQQDWYEWKQAEKHKISRSIEQQKVKTHATKQSLQTLNKHWLWCLLVLTLSLLWLERKLF